MILWSFFVWLIIGSNDAEEDSERNFQRKADRVQRAIDVLRNEYGNTIDLEAIAKSQIKINTQALQLLRGRMRKAAMTRGHFYVAVTGHSVCAGHGNYFSESYGAVLNHLIQDGFMAAGISSRAMNFGMGGSSSIPLAWCLAQVTGNVPDIVTWDFEMVEGKQWRLSEVFARSVWSLGAIPFFFTDSFNSPRQSMLEAYGTQGMPYAMTLPVEQMCMRLFSKNKIGSRRASQQLQHYVKSNFSSSPLLKDIIFAPKNEQEKRRKFNTPNGSPGRVKWHPGWRAHRFTAAVFATWLLSLLRDTLLEQSMVSIDFDNNIPSPDRPNCGDASLMCESPLAGTCATTYEPKSRGELLPLLQSAWPRVLAHGDPALKAEKLGLGYLDRKWTLQGQSTSQPLVVTLPTTTTNTARTQPSSLVLCEATTGWRRPPKLAALDIGCTVTLNGNRLSLTKIRAVPNCFQAKGRFKSPPGQNYVPSVLGSTTANLVINVTAPPSSFVYLSHIIWSSLPPSSPISLGTEQR
mmetsp:Transcript_58/g.97  ORF Transcript_58/g.97 Transcript_58/m.97 type:complete len:519 (+) Transcript_58:163-1719(+)|eukprot:CAMPEP_0197300876 /NCGR_PEP_ID=MMETSP0890-20130614/49411_1 /TAXON_ID=44058 ORGANISM="Aureoumbra lagunensis, Strain CCMP1510" /NCGR_SAMPLE_ID=MMETSP0890 /ASSEMBLY_ACC=CAM_ASM_000533 /LENGTH=518 /DNA_ID=CAMNT_0042779957 /DNA_START=25 /DNA_END=1581 /DNA_ORIENTATION=-